MNARFTCAIGLAGLYILAPLHAGAAEYHVVYDGKITDGADPDNIFGLAGAASIAGLGIAADVTYSTSVPGTRTTSDQSDEVTGGLAFGLDPVISSVVFTVGSKSFTFSAPYYGDVYTSQGYLDAYGIDFLGNNFQTYILPDGNAGPISLETPFSGTGTGDKGGRTSQYSVLLSGTDVIDFDATRVTISAAPEPATWAMMIAGFGAIGVALRRTRIRTTVAFA